MPNKIIQKVHKKVDEYKNNFKTFKESGSTIETDFMCGGYKLIKISSFKEIGFFDRNIFLYEEDREISNRSLVNNYKNILTVYLAAKESYLPHSQFYEP